MSFTGTVLKKILQVQKNSIQNLKKIIVSHVLQKLLVKISSAQ